jgi:hypothetical protein
MSEVESRAVSETPMCAAEVMAKAVYRLRFPDIAWETFKVRCPDLAAKRVERQRAALRALAEMEPTSAMFREWSKTEDECAVHNYGGHPQSSEIFSVGCLAAAEEGKK